MSLRILGGTLRGRRLPSPGSGVRPTGARQREALFAIWGAPIVGARMIDLFAGSGIMAFEASSRGAAEVMLIDASARVVRQLRQSVDQLVSGESVIQIRRGRLPACLARWPPVPADLIFADPPYDFTDWTPLIAGASLWLADQAELAIEHSARVELPTAAAGLERFDRRTWGESAVSRFRAVE